MKKFLSKLILILFCINAYSISPEEEYDFLLKDLRNYSTYGYKRTYDWDSDRSEGEIYFSQGNLQSTENYLDIAVQGNGFFKVSDSDGNSYYTRYGRLDYDNEFRALFIEVNNKKYFLDLKLLPDYHLVTDQIRILMDGSVECLISGKKENFGKIILYEITDDNVDSYDGYLVKTKSNPEIIDNSHIIMGALEMSNLIIDKILIRMLFVIEELDDSQIAQKETKKYLIQKMLDPNFMRVKLFGYFYEQNPRMDDISGLKDYVHFLERSYK